MIAHAAQWLLQGVTVSPIEPSEGMEFAKHGVINTGLVFFVAAILVTAVFGRFFCGWGCHLIALQDLSRWILIKVGIRPRPLRSRLLGLVPLVAFVYMFLWPAIYKVAVGQPLGPAKAGFLTSDFWATFPGLTVAVLTFFFCGFVIVFVLGSKGYCTYGCPYGAAFSVADRVAPIRIRVTDACQGCATCTAVCTSNVRVHEEVREHRMVVDPGCMKCLDCVANCPNEALYVGAGRPAIGKKGSGVAPGMLSWPEELSAAVAFVLGFAAFRGLYDMVPFLFSLGLAAVFAGLVVVTGRVIRRPDAWLGPIRLKAEGRLRSSGRVFLATVVAVALFWAHSAIIQLIDRRGRALAVSTADLRYAALDLGKQSGLPTPEAAALVKQARRNVERSIAWSLVDRSDLNLERAWLAFLDGDYSGASESVDQAIVDQPDNAQALLLSARLLAHEEQLQDAAGAYSRAIELDPLDPTGYLGLGTVLGHSGRVDEALGVFGSGLERFPNSVDLRYNVGLSHAILGHTDAAVEQFDRVLLDAPDHVQARESLAGVLAAAGRFEDAVPVFEDAVRRSPDDAQLRIMAARACLEAGQRNRAAEHIDAAILIDPSLRAARSLLD